MDESEDVESECAHSFLPVKGLHLKMLYRALIFLLRLRFPSGKNITTVKTINVSQPRVMNWVRSALETNIGRTAR